MITLRGTTTSTSTIVTQKPLKNRYWQRRAVAKVVPYSLDLKIVVWVDYLSPYSVLYSFWLVPVHRYVLMVLVSGDLQV